MSDMDLCLFGASPGNGNLGVSALMHSVVAGVARHRPTDRLLVFDHGGGPRTRVDLVSGGDRVTAVHGASLGRRVYRSDNLHNIAWSVRSGGRRNLAARAIVSARAVLDVSGGDSFSDIYGPRRFRSVALPKHIALDAGTPLVLLPQTYGPFRSAEARTEAATLVRGASQAWARDADSYEALLELLGDDADPARHRQGVDLAFALEAYEPALHVREIVYSLEEASTVLVGLNVSGLNWFEPDNAGTYGFQLDYRETVTRLVHALLAEPGLSILLVPHVIGASGESDPEANAALVASLPEELRRRVHIAPIGLDQCETKWVIGQTDWFLGTRMHATIAALSTGTPAATLAYSPKARGVFASADAADSVADARRLDGDGALEVLLTSFRERVERGERLRAAVAPVRAAADDQLRELLEATLPTQLVGAA